MPHLGRLHLAFAAMLDSQSRSLAAASWPFGPPNWVLIEIATLGLVLSFIGSLALAVVVRRFQTPGHAAAFAWFAFVIVSEAVALLQLRHASRCGTSYQDMARILALAAAAGLPAAWLVHRTSSRRRWSYPRLAVAASALAFVSTLVFVGYIAFFYVNAWCLPANIEF
jgi:hypothetical protein